MTPKKATEALKILAGIENSLCGNMIIYDGLRASTRTIRLRPRRPECKLCGEKREIMELIDYVQFCGMAANDKDKGLNLVPPNERIEVKEIEALRKRGGLIVDVRTEVQFEMCRLPFETFNFPLKKLKRKPELLEEIIEERKAEEVVFLCRKGNDSQLAQVFWKEHTNGKMKTSDVKGGLYAWQEEIDSSFPLY
ncbi:Oidioi.mRNA.OKI2018_I69.chr2.g4021.t1.cds [Oikopleura dioica]|uniref:Oidioi.mRNA.OKI2018_I69.chr2.g4021.t1.cds n=1 Tax=Oikopleura dioica TaxID=34765 RepID=A0ABN7SVV5_OIKDI|nr:Oidioi.mRNA.OKI2018_I69.chr2.g4021.t1.cds [Oikopleura dioica]